MRNANVRNYLKIAMETPTEYNLGLILLLSTSQNWAILLSVL